MILDRGDVVEGVEQRAGVEGGDDAVAAVGATALGRVALDGRDAPVAAEADLHADVGLGPAAVGDEGLLAAEHDAHRTARRAGQEGRYQLDVEGLGTAAEAAAHMGLYDPDAALLHVEAARQHEVDVERHLGAGVDGHAVPLDVVLGEGGVGLDLRLANLGAVVALLGHEVRRGEAGLDVAELEVGLALDVARPLLVEGRGILGEGGLGRVVGGEGLVADRDALEGGLGRRLVYGGDGGHGLAPVAHAPARERELVHGDGQDAIGLVAILARDHGDHARHGAGLGGVHRENLGVAFRAAQDAAGERLGRQKVGRVFGLARNLVRAIHQGHGPADGADGLDLRRHGWTASRTASMIFT